jgi:hypothetical protein
MMADDVKFGTAIHVPVSVYWELQTWKWPKTGIMPEKINMYAQELK